MYTVAQVCGADALRELLKSPPGDLVAMTQKGDVYTCIFKQSLEYVCEVGPEGHWEVRQGGQR